MSYDVGKPVESVVFLICYIKQTLISMDFPVCNKL